MRKMQKILLGLFLTGVLLGGIGTGVAFVEYSSIAYAGEKKIGQEDMVTENFDFPFEAEDGVVIVAPVWYDGRQAGQVALDESVPEGIVRYQVTYNTKTVTPYVDFREYSEEDNHEEFGWESGISGELRDQAGYGEDGEPIGANPAADEGIREDGQIPDSDSQGLPSDGAEPTANSAETAPDGAEPTANNAEPAPDGSGPTQDTGNRKVYYQGKLYLDTWSHEDFGLWMENKDEILNDLRNGRIANYSVSYISDVKILVNPATKPYIKQERN